MDLLGQRFGRLTVVRTAPRIAGRRRCVVICDCGTEKAVDQYYLRSGQTKTCGCGAADRGRARRLAPGVSGRNQLRCKYRRHAESMGVDWELSDVEFAELTSSPCFYCGAAPSRVISNNGAVTLEGFAHARYVFNGVDRLDNKGGYVRGNVAPCCWRCNRMKAAMGDGEFIAHVRRIVEHLSGMRCVTPG